MIRVLIAGGCGFLGSHLVDRLLNRPEVEGVVVVDNLWTGQASNLGHVTDKRLTFSQNDIESFSPTDPHFRFDEVYHFASPASPAWYMAEPEKTISANIRGAFRLLDLLKPDGLFCFASTSEVYGDPLVSPQPESYRGSVDCTGPRAAYDESKRCTEALLCERHRVRGARVRIARLFNVYGPRTRPDDGRAISNFIAQALRGEPITVYGDGLQSRSWGYVSDIIDGLEQFFWAAKHDFKGPLNIGNSREVSVLEIARYVQSMVPGSSIVHKDPAPQDPTNRCPDLTLARKVIPDWRCTVPYEEGILRTFQAFKTEIDRQPGATQVYA
jgi:nucleoside-diphosphate-sugar epimerase